MNRLARSLVVGGVTVVVLALTAASALAANVYRQTNLVADQPGHAMMTDTNLVNPWGLAAGPQTPLWVSDNGTGVATIYPGAVGGTPISIAPLVVSIPGGAPTGQVFNPTTGFKLQQGMTTDPALFIFDSEAGKITAWNADDHAGHRCRRGRPFDPARSTRAWRWRRPAPRLVPVCGRLPSRAHRRAQRDVRAGRTCRGRSGPQAAAWLRTIQHPKHRRARCTWPTPSRIRPRPRDRRARVAGSSTCTRARGSCCIG